jgi:hypothetical protein
MLILASEMKIILAGGGGFVNGECAAAGENQGCEWAN